MKPPRVGVVACSKNKADGPRRALELYTGRTFRASCEYLRAIGCERLVVLSALHGAVDGDEVLEPYERSLYELDAETRRWWALTTRARLFNLLLPERTGAEVHAIVPALYTPALDGLPRVTRHFAGLTQGRLYGELARSRRCARGRQPPRCRDNRPWQSSTTSAGMEAPARSRR